MAELPIEHKGAGAAVDCDVLVVGAGPTGLMAANLLHRSGVSVRLVERRAEPTGESRAFAVQARTVELFRQLGLADDLLSRGTQATSIELHVDGERRGAVDLDRADAPDTPYQFILMVPQSQTEAVLIGDLERLGVVIERGLEVQSCIDNGESVVTRCTGGTEPLYIRSKYVIGADGTRSVVRDAAGLEFSGGTSPQSFLLADCRVEWPLDHHRFRVFVNGSRIGLFMPLDGRKVSRVMTNDPAGRSGDAKSADKSVTMAEIESEFRQATGIQAKLSDPIWTSSYRAHHRSVDTYRSGRMLVAGDAAHIHSPAGGQGMNTGLQDVANLAWKLALRLNGHSDEELLDSYDHERRAVGHAVVRSTGKLFDVAAGKAGWQATLRDFVAKLALPLVTKAAPFHRNAFENISERKISYPLSRHVAEGPTWPREGPKAGCRVPDGRINTETSLHQLLDGYRFHLIALSREPLDMKEAADLSAKLEELAGMIPNCKVHLVARAHRGFDPNLAYVSDAEAFDRLGVSAQQPEALYLVRPDSYIAFRCAGFDFSACEEFMAAFAADGSSSDRRFAPPAPLSGLDSLAAHG